MTDVTGPERGPGEPRWCNPYDLTARPAPPALVVLAGAGAATAALALCGSGTAHAGPDDSGGTFGSSSAFDAVGGSFQIDDSYSLTTFDVDDLDDSFDAGGSFGFADSFDAFDVGGTATFRTENDPVGGSRRVDPDFAASGGDGGTTSDPLATVPVDTLTSTLLDGQFVPLHPAPSTDTSALAVAFDDTPSPLAPDLTAAEVTLLTGSGPSDVDRTADTVDLGAGPSTTTGTAPTTGRTAVESTANISTIDVTNRDAAEVVEAEGGSPTVVASSTVVREQVAGTTPERDTDSGEPAGTGIDAGTAAVVLGAGGAALTAAAERLPGVAAGQTAKGVSATVDKVVPTLDPRQERALYALNTDPIGTLSRPDVLLDVMEDPARTLARNVGSEIGGGVLSLATNTALAPLGPLVQAPLAGVVAKAGQKEIIDPALDRALAPERPSTVVAGADGTMARAGGRTELQNPLLEATSSSPIDDQLTDVEGRPLAATRNASVLTTTDGRPLSAPNALQRFVDGLTTQEVDTVTIYGADGKPVSGRPAVLGTDGQPVAGSTSGAVLRPTTTYGGAELDEVLAEPGRTQRTALTGLGVPDPRELRTTLPTDADPAASERRAVDGTRDTAVARRAATEVNPVPDDVAGASWTRTRGIVEPTPDPVLSRSTVAAMVGEGTKQVLGAGLRTAGVPGAAVTALDTAVTACAAAVCGVVGKAAEEVAKGSNPSGIRSTLGSAGRADLTANVVRTATTLAPDQLLNVGATAGAGYLANRLPRPTTTPSGTTRRTVVPSTTTPATRVGGAGAVVTGVAAPFVRQGLVSSGLLPADPLASDWRGQTATVLASIAEGAAGGLTSRGDALTGAVGNGINSFRRDTTAGKQLDTFSRQQHTSTGNPVVDRVRAAGSMATNGVFQVGNLVQVVPEAFTATGQAIGTLAGAVAFRQPLSEALEELNATSGPVNTRRALQEVVDTQLRYERNQREAALGVPSRPDRAPNGGAWCSDTVRTRCTPPESVDPAQGRPMGTYVAGVQYKGKAVPGNPYYDEAVRKGIAGAADPGTPGYSACVRRGDCGTVYVGTGSGTVQDTAQRVWRNVTQSPGGLAYEARNAGKAAQQWLSDWRNPARAGLRLLTGR